MTPVVIVGNSETIARDIASGAPVNADGTLHFLHYVAWLLKEQHHGH